MSEFEPAGKQNRGGGFSSGEILIIPSKDQNEGQLNWF